VIARPELAPHNGGYHFEDVVRKSTASFPMPVTNKIAPAVDNEVARLARKEYVPDTSAAKNKPEWIAAARLARDILLYETTRQVWDDKREHLIFNLVVDGISICRTWWDENDVEQTLVAAPDAVSCPTCKRYFASAKVPNFVIPAGIPGPNGEGMEFRHSDSLEDATPEGNQIAQVRMKHCPFCEDVSALQPFDMTPEEAQTKDPLGREMGIYVPRGEAQIEVVSVHEYFPENGGLGVEPYEQRMFSQVKVRPLEWIALRVPEFRDLNSEDAGMLVRYNPLYSDRIFQGQNSGLGFGYESYYNHARLFETVIPPLPIPGLEKGAWFLMCNDKVVRRELCQEVETPEGNVKLVPRVKYHFARFKRIPGNFHSRSFVDDMVPLNRRLNEIDAQTQDLRERGVPRLFTPKGTEIFWDEAEGGAVNQVSYASPEPGWTIQSAVFPGIPLTGSVYSEERAQIIRDLQDLGFPQDIEQGQAPGSVKTTSGLMLLSEEASQKRAPRERALVNLYESVFDHYLQLTWAFRREDAEYEVQQEGGVYERESYIGTDLIGDIRVKMAARIGYDQTLYNKEAAGEAIDRGLYKLDSPAAVDRLLDLMKLPKDVNENQTLQITRAEQVWSNFMKRGDVASIDATIQDPLTWYSVLGKRWLGDDAYVQQLRIGWNKLVPALTLWPQKLAETEAAEALSKPIYGQQPPGAWPQIQQQGDQLVKQAMDAFNAQNQEFQQISAQAPPGTPPPMAPTPPPIQQFPAPPPQGFLPDPLEQKIYTIWRRMLPEFDAALLAASKAIELARVVAPRKEVALTLELDSVLRMRSVIEAYRMMAQGVMQPGAPAGPPAPGAGGAPGGVPALTAGAPPSPPPGPGGMA
jgi:hypothetical protein